MKKQQQQEKFNPYSVVLMTTSDENFFYARSSNGYDVYGVLLTGEGSAVCSCAAAVNEKNCKHRKSVLARFSYITPLDGPSEAEWLELLQRIEDSAEREAVETLFSEAA